MADPIEMTALSTTTSILSGDYMWLKRGISDFKITIANLFGWHTNDTGNPHGTTKYQVGLGNVSNDAQLKVSSNLSDVGNVSTARNNLNVYSKAQSDTIMTDHLADTNPHNITLALLGFEKLHNYEISNSFTLNSGTRYASSKAVYDGLANLLSTIENSLHKKGDIIMWHGSRAAFEASTRYTSNTWRICDGSVDVIYGGTLPNLVGRIPRGASGDSTGTQLGSDDNSHTHSVATTGYSLLPEDTPEHLHEARRLNAATSSGGDYRGMLTSYTSWSLASPGELTGTTEIMKKFGGDIGQSPVDGLLPGKPHAHGVTENTYGSSTGNIPAVTEVHFIIKIV